MTRALQRFTWRTTSTVRVAATDATDMLSKIPILRNAQKIAAPAASLASRSTARRAVQ
jgi:hypothetical protein